MTSRPTTDARPTAAAPRSITDHLAAVRAGLVRLDARAAADAARDGALLVDIRYAALRDRDGTVPGAVIVERNELEWRLDPFGTHRLPQATGHELQVIVFCNEGYASSLAAASLHALGLHRATDLIGGFQSWRTTGLPVTPPDGAPTALTPHIAAAAAGGH
ncbi:rhodanese-like domain-containing protein [Streptomyces sp.]|uniref:rhodanese-like domain-containing protein n=1 Tax=Streptomyces sp. TaxID=1931 RepID=UPI002F3FBE2C